MSDEFITDGPFTFTVGGRTYVGHFDGSFLDADGNHIPHEVGVALYEASLQDDPAPVPTGRSAVTGEQVFSVSGTTAVRAPRSSMGESELLERHLQRWVKEFPSILGEDVLIVTEEFDRWTTASGDAAADRLDILALDPDGRLVVAELKRHRAPDGVLVQALNYAAMASRFDLSLLAQAHARFLAKNGEEVSAEEAGQRLRRWAPDVSDETLAPCRIVLVAEDYSPVLTNTCMFLLEAGLDLRLMRVGLHEMPGGTHAMTANQVIPVPQASDFMVRPNNERGRASGGRGNPRTERLVESGVIADGTELTITVPNVGEDRASIEAWLREDPERLRTTWHNDAREPIRWELDGSRWPMRGLIRELITRATGEPPRTGIWGPNWLVAPDGRTVARIDRDLREHDEEGTA
ncbi:hypothetical protein [Actinomycetospora aeridis]|uniref:Uncharacterized protein n=1 Tax=Actinomycetospora aeridis TaxID=3129231 RepID=A0ABU8NCD5_9PSEU